MKSFIKSILNPNSLPYKFLSLLSKDPRQIPLMLLINLERTTGLRFPGWHRRNHFDPRYTRQIVFDNGRKDYDRLFAVNAHWLTVSDAEIRKVIKGYVFRLNPGRMLDLGCGHARTLARLSWEIRTTLYGLDFSRKALRMSRYHKFWSPPMLVCADMLKIPFKDKTFDMVFSNGSYEHLRYPDFKEVRRVLTDDGVFICLVPLAKDGEPEQIWQPHNIQIENRFHKDRWLRLLAKAGLRMRYIENTEIFVGVRR